MALFSLCSRIRHEFQATSLRVITPDHPNSMAATNSSHATSHNRDRITTSKHHSLRHIPGKIKFQTKDITKGIIKGITKAAKGTIRGLQTKVAFKTTYKPFIGSRDIQIIGVGGGLLFE